MRHLSARNYRFDFGNSNRQRTAGDSSARAFESLTICGKEVTTTPVFFAYWQFAAERQRIFFRRIGGANSAQVTDDPILATYKFTNAYRASDRVSQYLIRNVIYREDLPSNDEEVFFRILLFKLFNKIETWESLERAFGPISLRTYDFESYSSVLSGCMASGQRVYSAAYIMPSCGTVFGYKAKHQNHLRLLEMMLEERFPERLRSCATMGDAYHLMLSAPSIGPFLAYQYATDLNYSTITDFSETEFVIAGPGALDGIHKCFVGAGGVPPEETIKFMHENQERYFERLSLDFRTLWGRRLQLIDCQNLFCEISKYARVEFPEIAGVSGRTRIKQKFVPRSSPPRPWFPPKWRLNERIHLDLPFAESAESASASAVQLITP